MVSSRYLATLDWCALNIKSLAISYSCRDLHNLRRSKLYKQADKAEGDSPCQESTSNASAPGVVHCPCPLYLFVRPRPMGQIKRGTPSERRNSVHLLKYRFSARSTTTMSDVSGSTTVSPCSDVGEAALIAVQSRCSFINPSCNPTTHMLGLPPNLNSSS